MDNELDQRPRVDYTIEQVMGKLVRVKYEGSPSSIGYVVKHPFARSAKNGYVIVIYVGETSPNLTWKNGLLGCHISDIIAILSGAKELCNAKE